MKKWIAPALLLLAAGYYMFYYPPSVHKRQVKAALSAFIEAVETKDREQIAGALERFLSDDAEIRLEIHFFSISQLETPPVVQDFDKQSFIQFIDNTLYPLTDYAYYSQLETFEREEDGGARVVFSSREWADGSNYYGGMAVAMRFSSNTECKAKALFESGQPRLSQAICTMQFRSVPKPSEIGKMQNMDTLRNYLAP